MAGFTESIRRARAVCCGRRSNRKFSRSRSIRKVLSMQPRRPTARYTASTMARPRNTFLRDAGYIWGSQNFPPDGSLFVGTGDQGKIFRVTSAGHGEVYYETGQSHVTCLGLDREGHLLAGSEPNGLLYRVTAVHKAFVLYNANLPEIRSIITGPDGSVYAAALGAVASAAALEPRQMRLQPTQRWWWRLRQASRSPTRRAD